MLSAPGAGVNVASTLDSPAPGSSVSLGPMDTHLPRGLPVVNRDGSPIVCTLSAEDMPARVAEWLATLATATEREEMPDGVRLRFDRATDVSSLARLAAAENECCRWATFTITIAPDEVTMDVTGSASARPMIVSLYGQVPISGV
jgi:hypothetical protein